MAKKKLGWFGWLGSVIIGLALLNWGLDFWFNLDVVAWLSFGQYWIEAILKTFVAVVGLTTLFGLIFKAQK